MAKLRYLGFLILLPLAVTSKLYAGESAALPVPLPTSASSDKSQLGKELFNDPLFSANHSLSCNSCHSLQKAGTDQLPHYIGINKIEGTLNTPTVLNAKLNFRQFWDGRAKNFAEVIDDHISDKTVFSNSWENIIEQIKKNDGYVARFKQLYPKDDVTASTVKDAMTVFLDNLLTPNSPFDKYLQGDENALSEDAKKGYALFLKFGCITCHEGPSLGGNLFQKLGIYKEYYTTRPPTHSDFGLYNLTANEDDKFVFKVPSLRNIELTGPYLHDGSIKTLEEMVEIMGVYQIGQTIPPFQINYIVTFLKSLNGQQEKR